MFSTTTPSGVVWSLKAYHNNSVPARLFLQEKSLPNKKTEQYLILFFKGGIFRGMHEKLQSSIEGVLRVVATYASLPDMLAAVQRT